MTLKPVMLLDVDGVVNACPSTNTFPGTFPSETWKLIDCLAEGRLWPIRMSTVVRDRVNKFSQDVEVRWLTTWQNDALPLGEAFGLYRFKVADTSHYIRKMYGWVNESSYDWWKFQTAVNVVEEEKRPLIWLDDDLTFAWRTKLAQIAGSLSIPTCLVQPTASCGLTIMELNIVDKFIQEYRETLSEPISGSL